MFRLVLLFRLGVLLVLAWVEYLVSSLGWEYIFWVNIPIGLTIIGFGWRMLPVDLTFVKAKLDLVGNIFIFHLYYFLVYWTIIRATGWLRGYSDISCIYHNRVYIFLVFKSGVTEV
jgi:hypothetical protein